MSPKTLLLLAVAALSTVPAQADTLAAALASAYDNNPDIAAQRAVVRQTDELVPQALTPARPQIGATASFDQSGLDAFKDFGRVFRAGVQVSQSLYRGGRTASATSAAENRILAARARLRATENQIVLNTVTAYADVLRYARVVELNQSQVNVFDRELQQSKDRFEVGDLTRTDVAQSQASLATAQANLVGAQVQLAAARQAYLRVVGRLPEDLEPMPVIPPLPENQAEAIDLARDNAPGLLAARFDEAAARYDVVNFQQARLPTLDAQVSSAYARYQAGSSGSLNPIGSFITQDALLTATIPLWQRGNVGTQTRQLQQRRSQLLETITSVDRQTQESVVNSLNQLRAARAVIIANKVAVDANTLAAEGVKQENQVGTRTIIEVLNAEQARLTSEVNLVGARRDEQVAAYSLLASLGAAEAGALGVPVTVYDSTANARRVRHLLGEGGDANPPALPRPDADRATKSLVIGPPKP